MPVEVILPKVDMDMSHGTIATWHVAEGEMVEKGAALFDIETEKAAMEVEAPASGRLHHVCARPGDRVAVGAPVAWIYAAGEVVGDPPDAEQNGPAPGVAPAAVADAPTPPPVMAGSAVGPGATTPGADRTPRASPAARAAARAAGLRLADVPGSGPRGRVQADDVARAAAATLRPVETPAKDPGGWTPQPGPLHVTRRAGTGAPIVLIHGFAADSPGWAPLERHLPARPLIRIDLPGHGRSPRRRIAGFADLSRMLVEAFDDATRDAGPVHLVGHSLGGALALALADIRGPRINSLTLIAPAGLGPQIDGETLAGLTRATRPESLAPWLRRLVADPARITDDFARAAMAPRRDPALRAAQAAMADALFPDGTQAFDLRAALERVTTPAQIIWGRQDAILPVAQAMQAPGDIALHLLTGTGHLPHTEDPDRVARLVLRLAAGAEALAADNRAGAARA
jgi:pyruvate dehydrogenase E2 component (dihydrolipoamide acetyltransferase)